MPAPMIFMRLLVNGAAVPGDVGIEGYENQIAVENWHWSARADHRSLGRNVRTEFTPAHLKLSKVFDRASTALYQCMQKRQPVQSCTLTLVDTALTQGKTAKLLELLLSQCHIESIATRAGGDGEGKTMRVGEDIVLSFATGKLSYFPAHPSQPGRDAPTLYQMPLKPSRSG